MIEEPDFYIDELHDVTRVISDEIEISPVAEAVDTVLCEIRSTIGKVDAVLEHYTSITNGDANPFIAPIMSEEVAEKFYTQLSAWEQQLAYVLTLLRD